MANRKKMQGEQVYNFAAGDLILENHPFITQRATEQLEKKLAPYPPVEGIAPLRKLTAEWMNSQYGTTFESENVIVTHGGKLALFCPSFLSTGTW